MKPATVLQLLALTASCVTPAAFAEHQRASAPMLPSYKQECAACHVAFPRSALPASSWQRIMSNLKQHYGTDASIDDPQVREIAAWLSAGAAAAREAPPEDRITASAWFVRKHREVPNAVWKRAAVKSASNCAACHTQADQGNFNEHTVRIPR
jgi:hypothetical protein